MGVFCRYLLVCSLFLLPLGLFANVNVSSMDGQLGQVAACYSNTESIGTKAVTREINVGNAAANLGVEVATDTDNQRSTTNPDGPTDILQ